MRKFLIFSFALLLILSTAGFAGATRILYTATDNSDGSYTLDFEVVNDILSYEIGWLSIFFGQTTDGLNFANYDQYSNLTPDWIGVTQAIDWDSYSFEYSSIDLPSQFNSDAMVSGIGVGDSLAGFSVTFDWTGAGSLDGFYFEVGDFDSWNTVGTGYTELAGVATVPEPATLLLVGTGMLGLGIIRKRKTAK